METSIWAVVILAALGISLWIVKRDISLLNQDSKSIFAKLSLLDATLVEAVLDIEDIREVLTEASRLKALRESAAKEELGPRAAVRGKRFVGLAERRAQAERASITDIANKAVVHNNNVRAMEGR